MHNTSLALHSSLSLSFFRVEAIYPVPNPNSMHDSRVKSLFQYAVKVENMMFENASSRVSFNTGCGSFSGRF